MLFAARPAGFSLIGLIIIIAILYFTGAGSWMWERVKTLDDSCYAALSEMGTNSGGQVCEGITAVVSAIDDGVSGMLDKIRMRFGSETQQRFSALEDYTRDLFARVSNGNGSLAGLTSSGERLSAMMQSRPQLVSAASSAKERLRTALDQFVIGQRYLQGNSPAVAKEWFEQSAAQPGGYGVLSQLTLGDMYRSGSYGFAQNPQAASGYYQQAGQSLQLLQQSNSPQARQLLKSLPDSPDQLGAKIQQMVQQLKQ
jgi:hypothetical protein